MEQLDAMKVFVRVAQLSSFTAAAESLRISKASASGAVQYLEDTVGAQLLHRTTRRVRLTQDGQVYFERCLDLLDDFDELQAMFAPEATGLRGKLRVDMPLGVAQNVVLPRLSEFLDRHPNVEIEVSSTDRRVNIIEEGFDCVIRVGVLTDSSLMVKPIDHYQMMNCVSPSYVERYGMPTTIDDLKDHLLVHFVGTLGAKPLGFEYIDERGDVHEVSMRGLVTVNNSTSYLAACQAGLGIIQVPRVGMRQRIAAGELVEVLPNYPSEPMPVVFVYPKRRHLPRRVQAFMAWASDLLRKSIAES
ncbi:MAG: LysR family transcriptional regulator [bacterium]